MQDVLASEDYRNLMTAKVSVGDSAPDFDLERLDGDGTVRLSALVAEQPVVLIFGSYT
jgi:peroxiredoxin